MQVSATLIAAQQAAREARARMQMPQPAAGPDFAAALEKSTRVEKGFSALPLKQVAAPAPSPAPVQAATPARLGMHVDITV